VERLPDGRMNLLITGASRFRVVRPVLGKVYARAEVEYLQEESEGVTGRLMASLRSAFDGYLGSLRRVAHGFNDVPDLPTEPEALAYLVAATLETSVDARQELLEAADAAERIRQEIGILRREKDLLNRQVLPSVVVSSSFSLN
jgi:Lon protease-like protein